ncbi:MAG TPA: hypothetical protein VFB12_15375, partial [Ktedonobacteraceae bacterium]|nr:hypothetical protein [Ktedonobacteraceae bacterium]
MQPIPSQSSAECQCDDEQKDIPDSSIPRYTYMNEMPGKSTIPCGKVLLFLVLLCILLFQSLSTGAMQFIGSQGWAYVLGGPSNSGNVSLLKSLPRVIHHASTPGATAQPTQ